MLTPQEQAIADEFLAGAVIGDFAVRRASLERIAAALLAPA